MNYKKRIETLRARMAEYGVDAVFTANDATWEYLTGLPRGGHGNTRNRQNSDEFAGLLVTEKSVTAFTPRLAGLGFTFRLEQFPEVDKCVIYPDVDINGELFDNEITAQGLDGKRVGVNRDVSSRLTIRLMEKHNITPVDVSKLIDGMRMIKDADEIELMRKASAITDQIYYDVMPMLKEGTPIREVEREIERLLEVYGCSYSSFPAELLNYGPKAGNMIGMPYGYIDKDHVLAYDYGVVLNGYCSDFGRTIFVQEPTDEMVRAYELVVKAQQAALDIYVPGKTTTQEMNAACHQVMIDAGMNDHFIHRMGHGIGKDVHEHAFMAEGEEYLMQPGMTFTDEPSLFMPGKYLVRVEDVVLCTENGFEYLNKVTKDIVVLK